MTRPDECGDQLLHICPAVAKVPTLEPSRSTVNSLRNAKDLVQPMRPPLDHADAAFCGHLGDGLEEGSAPRRELGPMWAIFENKHAHVANQLPRLADFGHLSIGEG